MTRLSKNNRAVVSLPEKTNSESVKKWGSAREKIGNGFIVGGIISGIASLVYGICRGDERIVTALATLGGTLAASAAALLFVEALRVQRKELSVTNNEHKNSNLQLQINSQIDFLKIWVEYNSKDIERLEDYDLKGFKCISKVWSKVFNEPSAILSGQVRPDGDYDNTSDKVEWWNYLSNSFNEYYVNQLGDWRPYFQSSYTIIASIKSIFDSLSMVDGLKGKDVIHVSNIFTMESLALNLLYLMFVKRDFHLARFLLAKLASDIDFNNGHINRLKRKGDEFWGDLESNLNNVNIIKGT